MSYKTGKREPKTQSGSLGGGKDQEHEVTNRSSQIESDGNFEKSQIQLSHPSGMELRGVSSTADWGSI